MHTVTDDELKINVQAMKAAGLSDLEIDGIRATRAADKRKKAQARREDWKAVVDTHAKFVDRALEFCRMYPEEQRETEYEHNMLRSWGICPP